MTRTLRLITILFSLLAAGCTTISDYLVGLNGLSSIEKKFVKLAFDDFLNGAGKARLIYKSDLYLYVHGNAASEFRTATKDSINILNDVFDAKLTNDRNRADIEIYIYRSDGSGGKIGAYTEALNYRNSYPIRTYGKQIIINTNGTDKGVGDARPPYRPEYFKPETFMEKRYFKPCAGQFFQADIDQQMKTIWARAPHGSIHSRPRMAIAHVFAGFYGPDAAKAYEEIGASADQVSKLARMCILEELGHMVTLWSDVDEGGIFEKEMPKIKASNRAEELDLFLKHRESDRAEMRELLAIYRRPGIRDGLTKAEVIEILKNDRHQ